MDHIKGGTLAGMLCPPPKTPRGRKKIKAENTSGPLLVVPYPILAAGTDQSGITITAKEGKTYRWGNAESKWPQKSLILILNLILRATRSLRSDLEHNN